MLAIVTRPIQFAGKRQGEQKTLTVVMSDAMCSATHMMQDKPEAECLRYCVKQGTKYALAVGKSMYTLEGHEVELDKYAAQKVTVKGALKGETVTVDSVLPAK
jgi:hypothetical protein